MLIEFNYLIDAFLDGVMNVTQDVEYAEAAYKDAANDLLHSMFAVEVLAISPLYAIAGTWCHPLRL